MKNFSNDKKLFCRFTSVLLIIMMLCSLAITSVSAEEKAAFDDSNVLTETLLLINANTNEILYSKNPDVRRPIASVTKLTTCILALENIASPDEYMIEITEEPIADISGQGASTAGFENHIGESFSALDIIYGLMLPSGCEAAQILAYEIGTTSDGFAAMMNEKVKELGCEDTYFKEGHGLSDENYSTASDLVVIAQYAMENPLLREIVSTEYYQPEGFTYPFFNTNQLIAEENNRGFYHKYVTGIKTGSTTLAGKCLVSSAQKGDDEFFCVALGGEYREINHAVKDTYDLYNWAFDTFTDNIYVDINKDCASVEVGESILINATTVSASKKTSDISWYSSDENVATVDDNGVVSGVSVGRAKITAQTATGNFDTILVSVGFYNGITLTSRDGDYTTGVKENVDWSAIKNSGFDFAVIRAGWGSEDYPNQNDPQFVNNVKGAAENEIPFYLSFVAYAQSKEEALAEADYFLREMDEYLPESGKDYLVSVLYNMTYSEYSYNSTELNTEIALVFAEKLKEYGYDTLVYANKSVSSNINIDELKNNGVGIYYRYYPYVVDFSSSPQPNGTSADMWEYRSDGYFLPACENGYTTLCLSYNKPVPKSVADNDKSILGDVDNDGAVNIKDATMIQKAAASIITLTDEENIRADANNDQKTNVKDATAIQKFVAGFELPFPIGEKIA